VLRGDSTGRHGRAEARRGPYNGAAMEIRERGQGDQAILELSGRLTVNDEPGMLKEAVAGAMDRGARHVMLDLSGVHYIDSTRLGELIAAHVSVSRKGGRLKLIGTPARIAELLSMAGLDGVFERYETVEAASRSLASPAN
jgi:anti-sigma B factor antagonist